MDNHPIPQDVTNFQFRLIGDMTIKQFAYLAGGVGLGWVCIALPVFWIIKIPLALIVAGAGVVLAFVPYEGRPSDVMLTHFIKALFTPNQYVYNKQTDAVQEASSTVQVASMPTQAEEKKEEETTRVTIQSVTPVIPVKPSPTETPEVSQLQSFAKEKEIQQVVAPQPTPPAQPVIQQEQVLQKQAVTLQSALVEAKKEEAKIPEGTLTAEKAHEKVGQLQTQLQDALQQKLEIEQKLIALQKSMTQKPPQQVFSPTTVATPAKAAPAQQSSHVRKIPKQLSKSVGLPITPDVPNLITGIVKDPRGNVLPNMLIEVKDRDGNPVRAFKTNNLGQFASATPLLTGTYTISFEDPAGKNNFDTVEINANGEILLPIEVISSDQREKLRQELFGAQ